MLVHKNSNSRDPMMWSPVSSFCRISKSRDAMWWITSFVEFPVLQKWQLQLCHVVKFQFFFPDSQKQQLQTAFFLLPDFCKFAKFSLQLWCHLWHHSCNIPTPNMLHTLLILYTLNFRWFESHAQFTCAYRSLGMRLLWKHWISLWTCWVRFRGRGCSSYNVRTDITDL